MNQQAVNPITPQQSPHTKMPKSNLGSPSDSEKYKTKLSNNKNPIYRVCLTGGPCAGKTTSQSVIRDRFQDLGWTVFRIPEAASLLLGQGNFRFDSMNSAQKKQFQTDLVKLMISFESAVYHMAEVTGEKCIILSDRGCMDAAAYIPPEEFQAIMKEQGWTITGLRDKRYDLVIHLVTAARGAEKFYTTANSQSRTEDIAHARELCDATMQAWVGHPYLRIIDNSGNGFKEKISRVVEAICKHVGEFCPGLKKRKYLIRSIASPLPVKFNETLVKHDFLITHDGSQARLRRRGMGIGSFTYSLTVRYTDVHGEPLELRRSMEEREYHNLRKNRDPERVPVKKKRVSFTWHDQYFELDTFISPSPNLMLLEVQCKSDVDPKKMELPPFIDVVGEVTGVPEYSMYNLAKKDEQSLMENEYRMSK